MGISNKTLKLYKYGFTNRKKKLGINYWRFFFNAIEEDSAVEKMFFIEFEMLNTHLSSDEIQLGFQPRVKLSAEDLQYALAGTEAAKTLETESILQPSYCCVRVGAWGEESKHLNAYFPLKNVIFNNKNTEIIAGSTFFSVNKLSGSISVDEDVEIKHPEYFCNSGNASWNLTYEIDKDFSEGFQNGSVRWFPFGIQTKFSGKINFNGVNYLVTPNKCFGYTDRFWGKSFPDTWFHISAFDLISSITGKQLFNSSISIQGIFDGKVSFIGNIEGTEIKFTADMLKKANSCIWDCAQMPDEQEFENKKLHWSASFNYKNWVIDVDVYCKIKELSSRTIELPEGNRKIMNLLGGGSGYGEIKLYHHTRKSIEQIEHAELRKVVCEFGQKENSEI